MINKRLLPIMNLLAFAAMVAVNAMANILPINNLTTGEVSALYPSLFTPAGITFSIWSVIYLLLLGFVIVQWRLVSEKFYKRLSMLFIFSCMANMTWIVAWHYLYTVASVIIMIFLLVTLLQLFLLLCRQNFSSKLFTFFVELPFSLYFAWICVALIANVSALLVAENWIFLFSQQTWTVIMMSVAALLGLLLSWRYKRVSVAIVICWALFGIYWRWKESNELLSGVAISLVIAIAVFVTITRLYKLKKVVMNF